MNYPTQSVPRHTKPKRMVLKIVIFSIILLILGVGVWVGVTAFKSIKKITAGSSNGSFFSFLGDLNKKSIKGQSEGRTNILLLGMGGKNHPGGTLSDTMIIISIDWKTNKVAMISVPRDLWVNIPDYGYAKLNNAHAYGEQNPQKTGGGGQVSSEMIQKIFDIPIHYYLTIDFEGFKKIVNEVGGVDILVEKDLNDPYYPAPNMIDYDPLKIKAGLQHMNGDLALKYARSRETTSDFDRSRRQEQVLVAIRDKVLTVGTLANPKKITDLLNIVGDHLKTNMSVGEIRTLWDLVKNLDTQNVINKVLDTSADGPLTSTTDSRGYIILPRKGATVYSDLQKIAQNIFNTSTNPSEELSIEVLNGTNKKGIATQVSQLLESYGYNVTKTGDAVKSYTTSVVINCSGTKADSVSQNIATTLNAEVQTKTSCSKDIDIQVIIGQNNL